MQGVGCSAAWFSNDNGVFTESPRGEANSEDCAGPGSLVLSEVLRSLATWLLQALQQSRPHKPKDTEVGECWPLVLRNVQESHPASTRAERRQQ